jgi:hypothetical protein
MKHGSPVGGADELLVNLGVAMAREGGMGVDDYAGTRTEL